MLYDPCWNDSILKGLDRVDELMSDEEHWFTGLGGPPKISPFHCPVTAAFTLGTHGEEVRTILLAAVKKVAPRFISVPEYNNHDDRTFEEVKHLIQVAKDIRREEVLAEVCV